ncbi:MAG: hypothetical protein ACRDKS_02510 [Actinomycetota bacterium]
MNRRVLGTLLVLNAFVSAACGSSDVKPSVGKTTTPPATSKPGDVDPNSAFVSLAGYTYSDLPAEVQAEARAGLESDPEAKKYITGFAMKAVSKDGEGVAVLMSVALNPMIGALIGAVRDQMAQGMAEGTGSTPVPFKLAGRNVFFLDDVGGVPGIMWDQASMVLAVIGSERASLEVIATLVIQGLR